MHEFIRFGIVGAAGTALYAIIYAVGIALYNNISVATFMAFAISLVFSFFGQSLFTFRVKEIKKTHTLRYIIVIAAIGAAYTGLSYLLGHQISEWAWLGFVVFTYPILSYLGHKFYTYSDFRIWGLW